MNRASERSNLLLFNMWASFVWIHMMSSFNLCAFLVPPVSVMTIQGRIMTLVFSKHIILDFQIKKT